MKNTLKYSLTMRKNLAHPEEPEKAYANLQLNGVLGIDELAEHIHEHNSVYSEGVIVGVLTDMCHCVREAITEGNAVQLGKLGRFTPTVTSEGALPGKDADGNPLTAMEMFSSDNIKDIHVNYELGAGMKLKRSDFSFEYTTTRKVQEATKRAQKKGEQSADWSKTDEEDNTPESPATDPEGGE